MNTIRHERGAVSPEEFFRRLFNEADARDTPRLDNREYSPEEFFAHLFADASSASHTEGRRRLAHAPQPDSAPPIPFKPLTYKLKRNCDGRITCKEENAGGQRTVWDYDYDHAGRLILVRRDAVLVEEYAYDGVGRRTMARTESTGMRPILYIYEGNRLVRAGGESFSYAANGALAASRDDLGSTQYQYAANGGLECVALPDGRILDYRLNDLGQPAAKLLDGRRIELFHWLDPLRLGGYQDLIRGLAVVFHYEQGRIPHAMTFKDAHGTGVLHLGFDQTGSLKAIADKHGDMIQTIRYDSFGCMLPGRVPPLYIPLGFAGGLRDRHTGLVRFVNRDYDPMAGRFTAPDPLGDTGGDHDPYEYCVDDPVNTIDPWGLEGETIPGDVVPSWLVKGAKIFGAIHKGVSGIMDFDSAKNALEGLDNATKSRDEMHDSIRKGLETNNLELIEKGEEARRRIIFENAKDAF